MCGIRFRHRSLLSAQIPLVGTEHIYDLKHFSWKLQISVTLQLLLLTGFVHAKWLVRRTWAFHHRSCNRVWWPTNLWFPWSDGIRMMKMMSTSKNRCCSTQCCFVGQNGKWENVSISSSLIFIRLKHSDRIAPSDKLKSDSERKPCRSTSLVLQKAAQRWRYHTKSI